MSDADEHLQIRRQLHQDSKFITQTCLPGLSVVEINPTELCNRTCSFCPRHDPEVYPNQNLNMSISTAETLLDQLIENEYVGLVCFSGFGEPTLNPDIWHLIKLFTEQFRVEMITNGDRFTSGYYSVDQLSECKLDSIIIDAYDGEQQYELFENLFKNYPGQYRIRKSYDTNTIDCIQEYNFNNRGGILGWRNTEYAKNSCYLPMYKTFVDWNGDILLCCNNWDRKNPRLGNIHDDNIRNIWSSDTLNAVRKNLLNGHRHCVQACKNCSVEGTKVGSQSASLWDKIIKEKTIL